MKDYIFYSRYYIGKIVRNIFSIYKWVVFIKPIGDQAFCDPGKAVSQKANIWFRMASSSDYEALVKIYPREFSGTWPEKVKRQKLFARRKRNTPCFLIGEGEEVLGATWCIPVKEIPNYLFGEIQGECFEMVNTFVTPKARKRGLGQALRLFAISCMAEKGFRNAISYVWYSRRDSLKMNLQSGSLLVAEKRQTTVLGRQMKMFTPYIRLDKLPLACGMPTLVLLGYDFGRLKGIARAFSKFGISVKPVVLRASAHRCPLVKPRYSIKAALGFVQQQNIRGVGKAIVLYADKLESAHALELEKALDGLANPVNSSSAIPDMGTQVIEAERAKKPVADRIFMDAIGEGGKIINRG
ncbi:GNAT family N-acetyltransferase [Marinobacter panjinensis]|uniref:GNAT family N-acetyltransferase n=1 Tax=Marinobacter panjinensis TaxID=2576384 RepID=A0A4U6R0M0_9GAMM|nr:GNAT family N-acetyltransferase [Marinobacter panjinensis]MCR8915819.1 GNAT family N-acetyltransferase [Marinobacter panjinensis]TKV67204.1 GNAT family N-acetyltransferase [Marinobacter panjinensis]